MTAKTRLRGAAAIATMAAVGAFGLPSQALAGKSHHLKLYKVEQHVDVEGDTDYKVSCKTGDIVTDGMWRIDDVSQDNEFDILEQWTQTVAIKATTVTGNTTDYVFRFLPIAGGDVQVKLIVTCLENPVTGNGHDHAFTVDRYQGNNTTNTTSTTPVSFDLVPGAGTNLSSVTAAPASPHPGCPSSLRVPIAPGFDMTGADGYAYVAKSWNFTTAVAPKQAGWEWTFQPANTDPFDVTVSYRCLERTSAAGGPGAGHKHRIVQQYKSDSGVTPSRTFRTHQVHCGEHYKGMVGMWHVTHKDHYFLGMDPRIKSRAFKFVNVDPPALTSPFPATNHTASLKLSCFKDRTT